MPTYSSPTTAILAAALLLPTGCSSASPSDASSGPGNLAQGDAGGGGSSDGSSHQDSGGFQPSTDAGPEGASATGEAGLEAGQEAAPGDSSAPGTWWSPSNATPIHFHWQLSAPMAIPADEIPGDGPVVYDIDGETNDAATVAALHALGSNVKVVCYVDVGTWENYRSDASQFPASVLGNGNGWPGEQWLDVRQQGILLPLMKQRFVSWCLDKGFDAIEPDNLDAWENNPGFPITEAENLSYDTAIAALAHSLGLSVGLKNLPENAPGLEPSFDWSLDEQCFEFSECSYLEQSFGAAGKAVWDVEYNVAPDCATSASSKMNAQKRDLNLVAPGDSAYVYQPCIVDTQTTW
jgi:hypothetical protein